jgi:transposase
MSAACKNEGAEKGCFSVGRQYSESFKRRVVQRLLLPGAPTARSVSREMGVPQPNISRWLREARTVPAVAKDDDETASEPRRPEDWTVKERLRAVLEAEELSDAELGEFLRREGLHEEILDDWRASVFAALAPASTTAAQAKADKKRIEKLEKELTRNKRALAAANAVVVLQKKVHALLGDGDDDTSSETDE